MRTIKKIAMVVGIVLTGFVFTGCEVKQDTAYRFTSTGTASFDLSPGLSVWCTYWDIASVSTELKQVSGQLEAVSLFEGFFDEADKVVFPKLFSALKSAVTDANLPGSVKRYLTMVNDIRKKDGTFSLKDKALLYRLFEDERTMRSHAKEIVDVVTAEGLDGVEIDYEAIRKDMKLWERFSQFLAILRDAAREHSVAVRVILEPGIPFSDIDFPDGVEYLVMCYNFHGTHNGPGPKASSSFLASVVEEARKHLPCEPLFLLATGGFQWDEESKAKALTEAAVAEIVKNHAVTPIRDVESGANTFSYTDKAGGKYQVWYADDQTLQYWMDTIHMLGGTRHAFGLWRLGGNTSLEELITYSEKN